MMIVALWVLSVATSFAYGLRLTHLPASGVRSAAKTLAILALAAIAVLSGGPVLLGLALLASALGDFFLSRPSDRAFLVGMAAFFLGHLGYIALMSGSFSLIALQDQMIWAVLLAVLSVGVYCVLWPELKAFRWPVMAYVIAILLMGLVALGQTSVLAPLFLVAALTFMASDSILALEKFRPDLIGAAQKAAGHAVWALYYAAQVLFTLTALG